MVKKVGKIANDPIEGGDRKNRNHRNLPKSPLKSGVEGDMGFGGAGRGKVRYVCVKVGWVLIT